MVQIPWPITNAPGDEAQEGAGKLTNLFVQRRGDDQSIVWRRAPGATAFVVDPSVGSAAGTSIVLGISSVVNSDGAAAGTATAPGVGGVPNLLGGDGSAAGTATGAAERYVSIAVDGSASGTASAEAESTV